MVMVDSTHEGWMDGWMCCFFAGAGFGFGFDFFFFFFFFFWKLSRRQLG